MNQEICKLREEMWNQIHKILDETEKKIIQIKKNEEIYNPKREY
jgi:hypothetical protein